MVAHRGHAAARSDRVRTPVAGPPRPARQSLAPAAAIAELQRAAGNRAVSALLAPSVQRFPIPTRGELEKDAGYTGGKRRKGTWHALGVALAAQATTPSPPATVEEVRRRAEAALETFATEKKRKKVGQERAQTICFELRRTIADCDVQLLLDELDRLEHLDQTAETARQIEVAARKARTALSKTVDQSDRVQDRLDRSERGAVSRGLVGLLTELGYRRDGQFWYPTPRPGYPLPHVAWKAHVACAKLRDAHDVVHNATAVLRKFGVQHKVDPTPETFAGNEKLVTIYPPPPTVSWRNLIVALEQQVGGALKAPPGEIPVGTSQRIGMRHGQITGLSPDVLQAAAGTTFTAGLKVGGYDTPVLTPLEGATTPTVLTTVPPSYLVIGLGVLYFRYPDSGKVFPAIYLDGVIRPDPRAEANPFGVALPEGVKGRWG